MLPEQKAAKQLWPSQSYAPGDDITTSLRSKSIMANCFKLCENAIKIS